MQNPDPTDRLHEAAVGEPLTVVAIEAAHAARLASHGIHAGSRLVVERDAPFRGPRIIRCGGARLALDRRVAQAVRVRPVTR